MGGWKAGNLSFLPTDITPTVQSKIEQSKTLAEAEGLSSFPPLFPYITSKEIWIFKTNTETEADTKTDTASNLKM